MRSIITNTVYEDIELDTIDIRSLRIRSIDGTWYHELEDSTWLAPDDRFSGKIRYTTVQSHGGLLSLRAAYEYIDGTWFCMRTSDKVPPALPKQRES